MGREIKFRAWDGKHMQYLEGGDFLLTYVGVVTEGDWGATTNHDWPLMQFTGMIDNDNRDIFEGDILDGKLSHNGGYLPTMGTVEYSDAYGAFGLKNEGGFTLFHNHIVQDFVVIGNIHQNPELLEVKP